jgi:hypothetical protein
LALGLAPRSSVSSAVPQACFLTIEWHKEENLHSASGRVAVLFGSYIEENVHQRQGGGATALNP